MVGWEHSGCEGPARSEKCRRFDVCSASTVVEKLRRSDSDCDAVDRSRVSGPPLGAATMSLIQATEVRAHRFPRQLAVLALVLVTMQSSGHADETAAEPAASRGAVGTAYCGLHCVYGAVRLSQPDAAFDRILKPDFINGTFGSSSENLIDAFAEFGIHAEFDPALALGRLQALNRPAILHVRPVGRRVYSH